MVTMVMQLMWRDGNTTMMLGLEVMPMITMMLAMVMIMPEMMVILVMMLAMRVLERMVLGVMVLLPMVLVVMVTTKATSTNISELADNQSPLYLYDG